MFYCIERSQVFLLLLFSAFLPEPGMRIPRNLISPNPLAEKAYIVTGRSSGVKDLQKRKEEPQLAESARLGVVLPCHPPRLTSRSVVLRSARSRRQDSLSRPREALRPLRSPG